jgi:hypothetical protein
MVNFIELYNFNGTNVLYYINENNSIQTLSYLLDLYIKNKNDDVFQYKIYILTNNHEIYNSVYLNSLKDKNIFIFYTSLNFKLFYKLHSLRHNYFYKNKIKNTEKILDIVNQISVPFDKYPRMQCYNRKQQFENDLKYLLNNTNIIIDGIKELDKENKIYEDIIKYTPIEKLDYYNKLFEDINLYIINNIEDIKNEYNFKEFADNYLFFECKNIVNFFVSNTIQLENVYYINKKWYDKNKNPINIDEFYNDFEYRYYENHHENTMWDKAILDIKNNNSLMVQKIEEEVMFLDYLYGFYNFGEFWDVIKRLMVSTKKNLPLFHLKNNRITNINYYFDKLKFKYPTPYQKEERSNKLFYFNKVNITIIKGGCRGILNNNFAYKFNKLFNENKIIQKSYNIYLARGAYGRSIQNESEIINILKEKYNFIVLNGTESLEDTIHYFTNAKIIFGTHGSLMKNMIWSKKCLFFN